MKAMQAPRSEDVLSTEHLQDASASKPSGCTAAHSDEAGISPPAPRERTAHQ
jgi:hypothetical protein